MLILYLTNFPIEHYKSKSILPKLINLPKFLIEILLSSYGSKDKYCYITGRKRSVYCSIQNS